MLLLSGSLKNLLFEKEYYYLVALTTESLRVCVYFGGRESSIGPLKNLDLLQ